MSDARLRIGLVAEGFGAGTGPSTYYRSLRSGLPERHDLCRLSGAAGGELDLVHVVDAKRLRLDALRPVRAPLVLDFHDDYWTRDPDFPAPDRALRRRRGQSLRARHLAAMARADVVVVHSEAVARRFSETLARAMAEEAPPVLTVPYCLPEEYQGGGPAGEGGGHGDHILFVGRDMFRKGFGVLIEALPRIMEARPGASATVVGDEYLHARAVGRFMARGLPVRFLPGQGREELTALYRQSDVLVLPSWEEAFGIVLIEAMANGLPVVASDVGGIPEAVEPGVSGLLHGRGGAASLAEAVISVLSGQVKRAAIIEGGRARAALFTMERTLDALDDAYRRAREARR